MALLDDIQVMLGLKPKDTRTNEEKLATLRDEAEAAEKLRDQTKEGFEYRQRINAANAERAKFVNQVTTNGPKTRFNRTQLAVMGIGVVVFGWIFLKSCI